MPDLNKIYLYRMTHIDNVPHILRYGITHKASPNANPHYKTIGDPSLISTRDNFLLQNGRSLGDYIPFYFGVRMPMLYVIQKGFNGLTPTPAEEIVYCVTSVQKVIESRLDFIYTDGHAVDKFSSRFGPEDINKIENQVDFKAVKEKDWHNTEDLDLKRRKQAEFLIQGDLPFEAILGFIVYNQNAQNALLKFGVMAKQIHISKNSYF
ncbi:MAG: hypothetical protein KatS3mg028_1566 [Bacteroidia bacterium]|nr:MAG: hypothetical protein KatS3mg028_1566 [Bacteroidia bacterium]